MRTTSYILLLISLLNFSAQGAQNNNEQAPREKYPVRKLTIEPAIGINPWPMSDMLISNLVQWNIKKRLSIVSNSSYTYNNAFLRNFNYIKTNYNFSLNQKAGIGTSFYSRHFSQTFSLMGGINYEAFKETLNNPDFEKVTVSVKSVSPDFGLMYNLKIGQKKFFFSYRMYIPLYPYPVLSRDINSVDGNMANFSVEVGVGIRLK